MKNAEACKIFLNKKTFFSFSHFKKNYDLGGKNKYIFMLLNGRIFWIQTKDFKRFQTYFSAVYNDAEWNSLAIKPNLDIKTTCLKLT